MAKLFQALAALSLLIAPPGGSQERPRAPVVPIGVCEALAVSNAIDGKLVSIRGTYSTSMEARWLWSEKPCSPPPPRADLVGAISIDMANTEWRFRKYNDPLAFDNESMAKLGSKLKDCYSSKKDADIALFGRFEGFPRAKSQGTSYGFGADDAFMGQLVVTRSAGFFGCIDPAGRKKK